MDLFDIDELLYGSMKYLELEDEKSNSKNDRDAYINKTLIFSDRYVEALRSLGEGLKCTRNILKSARAMVKHHHGNKYEDLYFIDSMTNKVLSRTDYTEKEKEVFPTAAMLKMLKNNLNIIAMHNHPTNDVPSPNDLMVCAQRHYKYGLIICHNGNIYKYKTEENLNITNAIMALNIFHKEKQALSDLTFDMYEFRNKRKEIMMELQKSLLDAGIVLEEVLCYDGD